MKKSKIIFALILLISMISNIILTTSLNVKAAAMDEYLVSKSKTATPLNEDLQTTVTLSLPSMQETQCLDCVDIVFVMDKSTSTSNANINFSEQVKGLVQTLKEKNIKVKVGIIKFRGTAHDAISENSDGAYSGLVRYTDDTATIIENAINSAPAGSGSNVHSGLQLANKWLEKDTEVLDSKKNVVLLTDGKSYIWTDEDGNAITNYAQLLNKNTVSNSGIPQANQKQLNDKYQWYSFYKKLAENIDKFVSFAKDDNNYEISFEKLYNSTNEELKNTTKYDTKIDWVNWTWGSLPGTAKKYTVSNPDGLISEYYEFTGAESLDTNVNWLEANPYEVIYNEDGTVSYTDELNEDYIYFHPTNLEKGIYKAAHLYDEMNQKYVMSVIYPAKNPAASSVSALADQFNYWMRDVSENSSTVEGDYRKIFDNIKNDSVQLITKGKVTDVIGKDFDLVNSENPFTLTLEDEVLTSTKISDNVWGFGEKDAEGNYPYKVTYDPDKEEFVWDIDVPVDVVKHVKLSYTLQLVNVPTEEGTYEFDTNEKAYLEFTSTYYESGKSDFEKPKVKYVVEPKIEYADIEVAKVWEDNTNNDGKRPDSITVKLLKDGKEVVDTITIDKSTWKGKFEHVPISKGKETYKYTVSEEGVSGYDNPEITGSVEERSFTIKNKHSDELRDIKVVKYWMDTEENNNRPKDIIIHLLADGVEVDSVTLSGDESEKWEYAFTNKPVYKGGKEIAYTISEEKVEGYEEPVYETEEDALVVKNIFDTSKGGENVDPSPKTGDNIVQMIVTLFVSIIGLTMAIYVYRKTND